MRLEEEWRKMVGNRMFVDDCTTFTGISSLPMV
jgi:hypothetical protein